MNRSLCKPYRASCLRSLDGSLTRANRSTANSIEAGAGSGMNICSNDEHVPEIERLIRTIKERARCMYNSVPFQRFPVLMLKEMVTACVFWLNMFPWGVKHT